MLPSTSTTPGIRNNSTEWTQLAAQAWPSGILLEDAIKAGALATNAAPTATEVFKGLYSLKGETLQGWSPPSVSSPAKRTH